MHNVIFVPMFTSRLYVDIFTVCGYVVSLGTLFVNHPLGMFSNMFRKDSRGQLACVALEFSRPEINEIMSYKDEPSTGSAVRLDFRYMTEVLGRIHICISQI